jgi:hypothetical protein
MGGREEGVYDAHTPLQESFPSSFLFPIPASVKSVALPVFLWGVDESRVSRLSRVWDSH